MGIMRTSTKTKSLENNLYFICEKCRYQLAYNEMLKQGKFIDSVKEIKSLYDKKILGQEAYDELLRFTISVYIATEVSSIVSDKIDSALREKLSPHRLLEALA